MSDPRRSEPTIANCWECEVPADRLLRVILRTRARHIGLLSICPTCFRALISPQTSWACTSDHSADAVLLIEPGVGDGLPLC
jgi:hypothetical protein